ncbi:hypothetical protein DICPUDRAFT_93179 [Dictyostelium purpureum]|uniref:PNPLA domain-containing protein n=1 Tax=Dictyostelium purpureum TaxID=5786 RepID=F1A3E8_DICPU|nr:uncharacterized protein DICPUDRAFT_93179 [Dictyostelium purpureum]EGC29282.1 hypothetical protein DICPUDRAFT_93179 [Dictyostelium purpureum]|eukprot:XP_003294192.1 hypothetical protein DICPUDRAFT_93179 [Dictyostelium purpureum]
MGYRVLSLDGGGGIRSIVQCVLLDEIEKQLYATPISDLFDYMIGSSTGGIVALSLATTNKTPLQMVDLFDKIAKKVYKTNTLYKLNCRANKYRNQEMIKLLSQTVSTNPEDVNSYKKVKVAVTSVLDESFQLGNEQKETLDYNEHIKPCIFPFYFRIPSIDSISEVRNASILDAGLATCATPSFFPSFKLGNNKYRDGALLNKNPCNIALSETKQLWNENNMDIFLSLGTGTTFKDSNILNNLNNNNNTTHKQNNGSISASQSFISSESEETYGGMIRENQWMNDISFRLNPELSKHISLDSSDESSRNLLKNESRSFILNNQIFNNLCSKLLSSLFYLDNVEIDKSSNQVRGIIKCRLKNVPSPIVNQLNIKSFITEQCDIELLDINLTPFSIPFKITSPPINNEIDIKCNLVCLNGRVNNTSISGSPFNLKKLNK